MSAAEPGAGKRNRIWRTDSVIDSDLGIKFDE
jgi:hypothetical protein